MNDKDKAFVYVGYFKLSGTWHGEQASEGEMNSHDDVFGYKVRSSVAIICIKGQEVKCQLRVVTGLLEHMNPI